MKHHSKTMQDLDESLKQANIIKRKRTKCLKNMRLETERAKALIDKINKDYGFQIPN